MWCFLVVLHNACTYYNETTDDPFQKYIMFT